ncbi:MAG: hypothetical protein IT445_00870 [Phycisphaeraceae bacterium]|nr:hypothetical protein [Phycisphaeraceae bacterium]
MHRQFLMVCSLCLAGCGLLAGDAKEPPSGDAQIRGKAGGSEIVITTTSRLAGAIDSLTWNGKELINSLDHGRQLQSACSFDCAREGRFWAECYNPTEAGSHTDGRGDASTSRLLSLRARGRELQTTTRMAFWLTPDQKSQGHPALNVKALSEHQVTKRVRIGYKDMDNVLDYQVTFTVPQGERHNHAQFEALTGYMPPEFCRFWKFDSATGMMLALDDGPGEQDCPVVLSTRDGRFAMGVFSPDQPAAGFEKHGYGRFRFVPQKVVKWNCVFRVHNDKGIAPGPYRYQMYVPIGTLEDVRQALVSLTARFNDR